MEKIATDQGCSGNGYYFLLRNGKSLSSFFLDKKRSKKIKAVEQMAKICFMQLQQK
jgi:hypothetical protein